MKKGKSEKDLPFLLKGFFDILIEYNEGVKNGTINRVDEFLRFYGNGDTKKGLQYIKDDLLNVDMASHFLSDTYDGTWGYIWENVQDAFTITAESIAALIKGASYENVTKNTNANKSFDESKDLKAKNSNRIQFQR